MIKSLKRRFVFTAMIAITVLILLLLGAINAANVVMEKSSVEQRIRIISDNFDKHDGVPDKPAKPQDFSMKPKDEHDILLSSTYFAVKLDSSGEAVFVDSGHIASLSEERMTGMAISLLSKGKNSGMTGRFYYLIASDRGGQGNTVTFLDTTDEFYACIRVLLLSAGVGIICWILMLLLVLALSQKAIRPIAENISKQKQFVTNAGHEIKTPLAIIRSNADAMELYQGESKWSKNIKQQTERLDGLMKNLLLLARMDESDIKTTQTKFSLSELLEQSAESFNEPLAMRGVELVTSIEPQVYILADREQILQLASILLDNVRKYAKQNSRAELILKTEDKRAVIRVKNSCDALPDVPPDRLFDRFYRADEARTQKSGGYGIGLSVARSIVRANNGKIKASIEPPETVEFTVKL